MKQRCLNPNSAKFYRYGAVGITVDPRWIDSFSAFLADMGERPIGTTIDRIDGTKGYHKANCRWSTPYEQQQNISNNVIVHYDGKPWVLAELARRLGLAGSTLDYRVKAGWPPEKWGDLTKGKGRPPRGDA